MAKKKIAELFIKLGFDTVEAEKMATSVRKKLYLLQRDLKTFGMAWSKYVTAPLTLAAGVAVSAADKQLKAERKLLVALKGRQDVQQRLLMSASELQSRSLFGDEDIIAQQAFLAGAGRTEGQIYRIIEAAAQLSSAVDSISFESAVKYLNSSLTGTTGELGESIGEIKQFTAAQLKAGAAIDFVLSKYKGFAEAAADTGLGPMQQLKGAVGDLAEEFGKVLMPIIQSISKWLKELVIDFQKTPPATKIVITVIAGLAAVAGPAALTIRILALSLPYLASALAAVISPLGAAVAVLAAATGAVYAMNKSIEKASFNRISKEAKKLIDSEVSIKELERRRAEYMARNQAALDRYNRASERLNPFKADYIPAYVMGFAGYKKDKEKANAELQYSYEMVKAIDEALKYQKSITPITVVDESEVGLISDLKSQIEQLEKKKLAAKSKAEIVAINDELDRLKTKLNDISNASSLGLIEAIQKQISKLEKAKNKATDVEQVRKINKELKVTKSYLDHIQGGRDEGLGLSWGFSDDIIEKQREKVRRLRGLAKEFSQYTAALQKAESELFYKSLSMKPSSNVLSSDNLESPQDVLKPYTSTSLLQFEQAKKEYVTNLVSQIQEISAVIQAAFSDLAISIGEGLGSIFAGDSTFDDLLASFGKVIGQFLVNLGKMMVTISAQMLILKKTAKQLWSNPVTGILAGIAAIAAGTALISAFNKRASKGVALANGGLAYGPTMALVGDNKGAGSDPEVIAPLSKLRQYGLGRQAIEFVGGEFRLSGSDLLLSIRREDARITYVNALA